MDGWKSLGRSARRGCCAVVSSLLLVLTVPVTGQVLPAAAPASGVAPVSGPPQTTLAVPVSPPAPAATPPQSRSVAPPARDPDGDGKGMTLLEPPPPTPPTPSIKVRRALVIGNAKYGEQPLKNPTNDAEDMARVLTSLHWEVTLLKDGDALQMKKAVSDFIKGLNPLDDAALYYSGHGVQINGENFLLPIGTRFTSQQEVIQLGVSATQVLKGMATGRSGVNILILDACRDNPLPATTKNIAGGLAALDPSNRGLLNSLVAYATAAGRTASDGTGRNGTFTAALLGQLPSDVFVGDMFMEVRERVHKETEGAQTPWEEGSLITRFRFTSNEDPLQVKEGASGEFIVHQAHPSNDFSFRTLGTASEVRRLALNAHLQSSRDWPLTLKNGLVQLDQAIGLLSTLDDQIEGMAGDPECSFDRQRLVAAKSEADADRANGQQRGVIVGIRAALNQDLRQGCEPSGPPWKMVTLIGASTVVAASTIVATVFLTKAAGKWSDARESCTTPEDGNCEGPGDRGPSLSSDAKAAADLATVFYSVSAVAIAGGLAAYFFWPDSEESVPGIVWGVPAVDVHVSRESTQVSARVRF